MAIKVYFSDYFSVSPGALQEYGAFNVSLINDLPLFIDPFLLFNSDKQEYRDLHDAIIQYIRFLRELSGDGKISNGHVAHLFTFKEVKQNWLGYSMVGNSGSGLGSKFAIAMNENLSSIFNDFGEEKITKGSHLEKLCLIKDGVGKDAISDFTTNLIKGYLCEYTQAFAEKYLDKRRIKVVDVSHASFNYQLRRWMPKRYTLPYIDGDYVLLTPKDILTKDEAWINRNDIVADFEGVIDAVPNDVLRAQINDYFLRQIPSDAKKKDVTEAAMRAIRTFPQLVDYYIRYKEENGYKASAISEERLKEIESQFISQVSVLVNKLVEDGNFYKTSADTFDEACRRVQFLKQVIENNDGYRIFYIKGKPVQREIDLQLMFRLTWFASYDDVNAEVNNGRGPVDYKISRGSRDSTLVEFKLASNSKLKQNLAKQVEIYEKASLTRKSIKVVLYFTAQEYAKVKKIMAELKIKESREFVLIDAGRSEKPSASRAK